MLSKEKLARNAKIKSLYLCQQREGVEREKKRKGALSDINHMNGPIIRRWYANILVDIYYIDDADRTIDYRINLPLLGVVSVTAANACESSSV